MFCTPLQAWTLESGLFATMTAYLPSPQDEMQTALTLWGF